MLVQPALLRDIVEELSQAPPIDESVMEDFLQSRRILKNNLNRNIVSSMLSEMWLRKRLQEICIDNCRVDLNPIEEKAITRRYLFIKVYDNIVVYLRRQKRTYSDFDHVIVVENVPVLFEIKLAQYQTGGRKFFHSHVVPCMHPSRVNQVLAPVKEYFRTKECAYVLVISPDQINEASPIQNDFKARGGLLVPFYTTKDDFRKRDVPKIVAEYGIPVRDQHDFTDGDFVGKAV